MIITFCGHSKTIIKDGTKEKLLNLLEEVVNNTPVDFYLGGYGTFDLFAKICCDIFKKNHVNAKCYFVTPYLSQAYIKKHDGYDGIIVFDEIEKTPKKYAILKRNKYMVDKADFVISYIEYSFGGAYKTLRYAMYKKKKYINLYNEK